MTTTIDTNQWCGQFKRCNGCKLQSECMVKPEEMFPVMEDGKYVDKWAIRTTAMIEPPRESWRLNSLRKR